MSSRQVKPWLQSQETEEPRLRTEGHRQGGRPRTQPPSRASCAGRDALVAGLGLHLPRGSPACHHLLPVPAFTFLNNSFIVKLRAWFEAKQKLLIKNTTGLPWWLSGWESACQCRGHGFEPWSGKIPHAVEQLGPCTTTTEPARLQPVVRDKRGRDSERPTHGDEAWPPLAATGESPRTETKTQHSHK